MRSSPGRPSSHLLTQFVWDYCPSLDAMGLWHTRVYDVQTCTLKQSNGSAFIGIKFLTAFFFLSMRTIKAIWWWWGTWWRVSKVNELVSEGRLEGGGPCSPTRWNKTSKWICFRLWVQKRADMELVTRWMLDWAGITMRCCVIRPLSTYKLSLRHGRLILTFLQEKVVSKSRDTIVRRYGFRMKSWFCRSDFNQIHP